MKKKASLIHLKLKAMELVANNEPLRMVQQENEIVNNGSSFIEANTEKVTLRHLKEKCIIPVFSKDSSILYFVRTFDPKNKGGEFDQEMW